MIFRSGACWNLCRTLKNHHIWQKRKKNLAKTSLQPITTSSFYWHPNFGFWLPISPLSQQIRIVFEDDNGWAIQVVCRRNTTSYDKKVHSTFPIDIKAQLRRSLSWRQTLIKNVFFFSGDWLFYYLITALSPYLSSYFISCSFLFFCFPLFFNLRQSANLLSMVQFTWVHLISRHISLKE